MVNTVHPYIGILVEMPSKPKILRSSIAVVTGSTSLQITANGVFRLLAFN